MMKTRTLLYLPFFMLATVAAVFPTHAAGSIQFSSAAYSVGEAGPAVTITVTRTGDSLGDVTVRYATANGTATAGADYTATTGTLSWTAGVMTDKTFTVPVANDALPEPDESFKVLLSSPTGGSRGRRGWSSATVTIADNDPAIRLSAATYSVGEAGPTVTITATRTGGNSGAVEVRYATSDGTAAAGSDYTAVSGTLLFAAWQTGTTFAVTILNDALAELNETFTVTLSAPTGGAALSSPYSGTVTIIDDEPPTVQFSQAASRGVESATPAVINVALSAASGLTVTVNFATANGSATVGSDYTAASGTLTFTPGVTSRTISVPILTDTATEPDETFLATLSAPVNATLGAATVHTYTIINENSPPVLSPIGNRTVAEAALLQFTVAATDIDGDPLSFSASGLPAGATFNPNTRIFSWTPSYIQGGSYPITISVTDGMDSDSETFTVTVTQTNPTTSCEGCHNSSPYDPDGSGPAPAAPNVMGDGDGVYVPGQNFTTPKPYDDGTYGYNVNGHGRDNDTSVISKGNAINNACSACHDIAQPPGEHLNGILNGRLSPDTRNANSFHLNSSFISASAPASEWDVQVRFDDACYNSCHKNKTNDMRHGYLDLEPALNARQFGAISPDTGQPMSRATPSNTPPPIIFYDMHLRSLGLRSLGGYDEVPNGLLCVSCHDPHGTNVVTNPVGNNRMMLYRWSNPTTLCAKCH